MLFLWGHRCCAELPDGDWEGRAAGEPSVHLGKPAVCSSGSSMAVIPEGGQCTGSHSCGEAAGWGGLLNWAISNCPWAQHLQWLGVWDLATQTGYVLMQGGSDRAFNHSPHLILLGSSTHSLLSQITSRVFLEINVNSISYFPSDKEKKRLLEILEKNSSKEEILLHRYVRPSSAYLSISINLHYPRYFGILWEVKAYQ